MPRASLLALKHATKPSAGNTELCSHWQRHALPLCEHSDPALAGEQDEAWSPAHALPAAAPVHGVCAGARTPACRQAGRATAPASQPLMAMRACHSSASTRTPNSSSKQGRQVALALTRPIDCSTTSASFLRRDQDAALAGERQGDLVPPLRLVRVMRYSCAGTMTPRSPASGRGTRSPRSASSSAPWRISSAVLMHRSWGRPAAAPGPNPGAGAGAGGGACGRSAHRPGIAARRSCRCASSRLAPLSAPVRPTCQR